MTSLVDSLFARLVAILAPGGAGATPLASTAVEDAHAIAVELRGLIAESLVDADPWELAPRAVNAEAWLARARALLERFEWSAGDTPDMCPECGGFKPRHGASCELGELLAAGAPMPVSTAAARVQATVPDTLQGGDDTKKR